MTATDEAFGSNAPTWPAPGGPRGRLHLLDATILWGRRACGGVSRAIGAKRIALVAKGWRHTLLAPGVSGAGMVDCGGWPLPVGGCRFVVNREHAVRLIERAAPDIIEAGDPYTLAWATLDAARRLQAPSVAFCHINLPALAAGVLGGRRAPNHASRWAEHQARLYLAQLYGRFDMVLAPSRQMAYALRDMGVRQAQHQPLGVDCAVFHPSTADAAWRHEWLRHLDLPPSTRLLVYTGRFGGEKNLQIVADALALLGPDYAFVAVGSGPRPPHGHHVRVLPPETNRSRLARLVASCDLFVHPGDEETSSLAALEAMACGTPVLASALGGLGELVDGVGTTLHSQRAAVWADAIETAVAQGRGELTRLALARAHRLDWRRVLNMLEQRYLQLARLGPPLDDGPVTTSPKPTQPPNLLHA